ncbi:hypothetical protein [Lysobacter claricitrinus]|uniref:hypothetical protein n=1 Tax=Lysobacter claricitrinus TaxID=3367728 RepID=UPI0037DBD9BB
MRPSSMHPFLHATTLSLFVASLLLAAPAQAYTMRNCRKSATWTGSTEMVADLNPGAPGSTHPIFGFSSTNELMAEFNDTLYFQADDGTHGSELWRVGNGSPTMVGDIAPGATGSQPHAFARYNGALFFAARSSADRDNLYMSNGSAIAMLPDPAAGGQKVEIAALTVYAGNLYFVRYVDGAGKLWRYNGTTTQLVGAANAVAGAFETSSLTAHPFVVFKDRLYFVKAVGAEYRLWAFDGTAMKLVKQLAPAGNTTSYGFDLGVYGDAIYFGSVVPADPPFESDELWKYTGIGAPAKVATLPAHAFSFSQPGDFTVFNGKLYFTAAQGLHRFDGSNLVLLPSGPAALPWGVSGISPYTAVGSLFFSGFHDDWQNAEPYIFNGSQTALVRDIMPADGTPNPGSFPSRGVQVDDMLFFSAEDNIHGRELWRMKRGEASARLDCDIVVIPLWDDWRLWIVDEREVIVATWLAAPNERPRLISRERTVARRDQPLRVQVLKSELRRNGVPEGASLVTRVYDAKTGAIVDRGDGTVGVSTQRVVGGKRANVTQVGEPPLREVMGERLYGM